MLIQASSALITITLEAFKEKKKRKIQILYGDLQEQELRDLEMEPLNVQQSICQENINELKNRRADLVERYQEAEQLLQVICFCEKYCSRMLNSIIFC